MFTEVLRHRRCRIHRTGQSSPDAPRRLRAAGFTLIEATVFIVVVAVAAAGVTLLFNGAAKGSAQTLGEKQAYAVAEALLREAEGMPFTYCDPKDARVATATGAFLGGTGCATTVQNFGGVVGPAAGELRLSAANPFNNVGDYNGFPMAGVVDDTGAVIGAGTALTSYTAIVKAQAVGFGGIAPLDANNTPRVLLITVTVNGSNGTQVVLEGIRTRYAPNTP